jgi:hypothetical protein
MKQYYGICEIKWNLKQLQWAVIMWWKPNCWRRITFLPMCYTYIYICVCLCVSAYVRVCARKRICLFYMAQLQANCLAPYVSGISRFLTRLRPMKLFSPVNMLLFILLSSAFGNCAAFLGGGFRELHHCCREATNHSFCSPNDTNWIVWRHLFLRTEFHEVTLLSSYTFFFSMRLIFTKAKKENAL